MSTNKFIDAVQTGDSVTGNGAVCNSTTGSLTLDYFSRCSTLRGRPYADVAADMVKIFSEDPLTALKIVFYNRMITRKVIDSCGEKTKDVQKGQGQRDEFVKSLKWIYENRKDLFINNIHLVPLVGCWKDLWYDSEVGNFNFYAEAKYLFPLIKTAMRFDEQRPLIAKYLPKIRSRSKVFNERQLRKNAFAFSLCNYLGWSAADYRRFKSSPENNAHLWQRQMSDNDWQNIDFDSIPGRAMFFFAVKSGRDKKTVVERHGLTDKYLKWLEKRPTVKFTGYAYELFDAAGKTSSTIAEHTINKQFEELLKKSNPIAKDGVLCALDVSPSMSSFVFHGNSGSNMNTTPLSICLSLGIYFSTLMEGSFHNHVVGFSGTSKLIELSGKFTDKIKQIKSWGGSFLGGTNFQSVIDLIVDTRKKNPNIPIEDYPKTLLVVSDMQMDDATNGRRRLSNYEVAMLKLKAVGLPKMTIIWWNVNSYEATYPSKMNDNDVVMLSGCDGSILDFVLGEDAPKKIMSKVLDQEVLNRLTL